MSSYGGNIKEEEMLSNPLPPEYQELTSLESAKDQQGESLLVNLLCRKREMMKYNLLSFLEFQEIQRLSVTCK